MSTALRAPSEEDVPHVVELMSERWPDPIDEETVRLMLSSPNVDRQHDARLGPDCYAFLESLGEGRVWVDLRGRPTAALLDWAESRATEKGRRAFAGAWSNNEELAAALRERGFRAVRRSYRMAIDLAEAPPAPLLPAGVTIRSFEPGDERTFYELHEETFEDTWEHVSFPYEEWADRLLNPPRFVPDLWFLAVRDGEPAGFAICYPHTGNPELGWVGMLGVGRAFRRLGLGRALLTRAFAAFRERGLVRAGLGVDADSLTGAHRLYERAGMHVTARFDIYAKELS
jgi:mycothiol synthase